MDTSKSISHGLISQDVQEVMMMGRENMVQIIKTTRRLDRVSVPRMVLGSARQDPESAAGSQGVARCHRDRPLGLFASQGLNIVSLRHSGTKDFLLMVTGQGIKVS